MILSEVIFNIGLTVAGAVLGLILTKATEAFELPGIGRTRRKALSGRWEGEFHQIANRSRAAVVLKVTCEIHAGMRRIRGTMNVSDDHNFSFSLKGTFEHNQYLRVEYSPIGSSADVIDFGECFLALGDVPNVMSGLIAGWGSISHDFVSGTVVVRKVAEACLIAPNVAFQHQNRRGKRSGYHYSTLRS
jgi:hypothetical protein